MTRSFGIIGVVFGREFQGYFATPLAAVFLVVFVVLVTGMTFMLGNFFERNQADLIAFFAWHPWLFLVLMPAIGMRLWAEERRSGTIELLTTLPVRTWELVLGKFLAGWAFTGITLVATMAMWLTVNYLGAPDNAVILGSYLGSWLMAGAFLAISACLSALTKSQVIAFIVAGIACFLLASVQSWAPAFVVEMIQSLSFLSQFDYITRGVVELPTLFFFVSAIALCLWLNVRIVDVKKAA
jgi:ABC-2 type transport system permease protein